MPIAIQPSRADEVRRLAAKHSYLDPIDIAATTGSPLAEVRNALVRRRSDKPKSQAR